MKTTRIVAATVLSLSVLVIGVASAAGAEDQFPDHARGMMGLMATHPTMHDTEVMETMHASMPGEAQARCDAMHTAMAGMMGGAGMVGGHSGATDGTDPHHPAGSMGSMG